MTRSKYGTRPRRQSWRCSPVVPLGVTVTKVADALGVTRKHVSAIVNGRAPITPDMAVRLAGVFGTEPEIWVNLQAQYDLWLVRQQAKPKVKPLHAVA
ncbi:MAG: HigA family addiction module antidote protein [Gammaproteobacteria bacterium]|nr:MAG: HigA family addiction module antidote protein [Gammaproteobacteria bacterium]TLY84707.1 MAG: HigA family addiction module antidote protein [Gammaproteobacteria bacterium]